MKITIENDGNTTQLEGKCCIFTIFEPKGSEADIVQGITGYGSPEKMLIKVAMGLYELADRSIKDETTKMVTAALMVDALKKAILGETSLTELKTERE